MEQVTQVTLTEDFSGIDNFEETNEKEMAVVYKWQNEGVLRHVFAKSDKTGAILIFNETDQQKLEGMIATLPFFPCFKEVEYLVLNLVF
jgi:muconolactone delta-isomerase